MELSQLLVLDRMHSQFFYRLIQNQNIRIVNLCDSDNLGKIVSNADVEIEISKEYFEFNAKEFLKIEDTYVNYIDHKHIEDLSALFLIKKDQVIMLTSGEYNERHCDYIVTALEDFDSHKLSLEFNEYTSATDKKQIEIAFYKWLENRGVVKFHNFSEIHVSYVFGGKKKEICLAPL